MERVRRELDEGKVVLIAGFQGVSPGNDITTLGRGGSDTTAVAAAAAGARGRVPHLYRRGGRIHRRSRLIPEARRLSAVDSEECSGSPRSARRCRTSALRRSRRALPSRTVLSSLVPRSGTVIRPLPLPEDEAVSPP